MLASACDKWSALLSSVSKSHGSWTSVVVVNGVIVVEDIIVVVVIIIVVLAERGRREIEGGGGGGGGRDVPFKSDNVAGWERIMHRLLQFEHRT